MESIIKLLWQTPSLVSLSGVRHSAEAKVTAEDETTFLTGPSPALFGTPTAS